MASIPSGFHLERPDSPAPSIIDPSNIDPISSAQEVLASSPLLSPSQKQREVTPLSNAQSSPEWPEKWIYAGTAELRAFLPRKDSPDLNSLQLRGLLKYTQEINFTKKKKEQAEEAIFPRLDQLLQFSTDCESQKFDPAQVIRYLKRYSELCIAEQKQRNRSFQVEQSEPVLAAIKRAIIGATVLLLDAEKDVTQHSRIFLSTFALFADQFDQSILQDWKSTIIASFEERIQKMHEACAINQLIALEETCSLNKANRATLILTLRQALEQYARALQERSSVDNSCYEPSSIECPTLYNTVRAVILSLATGQKTSQEREATFQAVIFSCKIFLHSTTISKLYNETVLWDVAYDSLRSVTDTIKAGTADPKTILHKITYEITNYIGITQTIDPDFAVQLDTRISDSLHQTALFLCQQAGGIRNQESQIHRIFNIYDKWLKPEEILFISNKTKLLCYANELESLAAKESLSPLQVRAYQQIMSDSEDLIAFFKKHTSSKEEWKEILNRYGGVTLSSCEQDSSSEEELDLARCF